MNGFSLVFMVSGFFFLTVAAVGAVRLPDFYTRSHAIGVTDTLGTLFILGALVFHIGMTLAAIKLIVILLFVYIANPTITHVLIRAALRAGLKPWKAQSVNHD